MDYWKMYLESGLYVGKHRVPFEATTAYRGHLIAVYADKEFIDAKNIISDKKDKEAREAQLLLAQKYGIRVMDLELTTGDETYRSGRLAGLKQPFSISHGSVTDKNYLNVSIDMRITEYEFKLLWEQIQTKVKLFDVHKSKKKGPESPQLLYAIFRAKVSGFRFKEIFDQYTSGNLTHYKKRNSSVFLTVKSFTDYYYKYYPHLNRST